MKHYAPNRCEPSIEVSVRRGLGVRVHMTKESKLLQKMLKKSRVREGGGGGGQGGYEQRIEVIVKIA